MREMNFKPNPLARRLAGGSGRWIALVYPLASPTMSAVELRFITSIAEVVNRSDYTFLTLSSPHVGLGDLHQIVMSGIIDGIILMRINMNDPRVELLAREKIPFVMIGRTTNTQGVSYVDLDSTVAIEMGLAHLVKLGHTRMAFIHPDDLDFGFARRLVDGYRNACERRGLPVIAEPAELSDEAGYRAMIELLDGWPDISAVIVWSDVVASGAIRALHERGRVIPDDMSVISFDRSAHLQLASSELTIIDTRAEEVGATAARVLIDLLNGRMLELHQVLVAPRLIVGESTGPRYPAGSPRREPMPAVIERR